MSFVEGRLSMQIDKWLPRFGFGFSTVQDFLHGIQKAYFFKKIGDGVEWILA